VINAVQQAQDVVAFPIFQEKLFIGAVMKMDIVVNVNIILE
jgi:hypothetical protein